jgi:hypothetical protein
MAAASQSQSYLLLRAVMLIDLALHFGKRRNVVLGSPVAAVPRERVAGRAGRVRSGWPSTSGS